MEFTKHSGATRGGLDIRCLEVDGGLGRATRVAERLAAEAQVGLVDAEKQRLEFGKPFHQHVQVGKVSDTGRQLANHVGRRRFLEFVLRHRGPRLSLEILGKEAMDVWQHVAFQLIPERLEGGLGWRVRRGDGRHGIRYACYPGNCQRE